MNMDRYLDKTLGGQQGKLICQLCNRLVPVLVKKEDLYVCDLCEKRMEEERDE